MNRIARLVASAVSLSLILASTPYEAAAQVVIGRSAPSRLPTAFGSGTSSPYGSVVVPSAASLQAGLVPSLSPSAAAAPVLSAPAAPAALAVAAPLVPAAAAVPALVPAALKAVIPVAAAPEKAAAPVSAAAALRDGANALSAAAKRPSADASRAALDALFEGSVAKPEALAVSALSAPLDNPRLSPSSSGDAAKGPPSAKVPSGQDGAPRTSLKRTLSVGFLAAVFPIALTFASIFIAQAFGYHLHSNYHGPSVGGTSLLSALALWVGAAVMAPVSEEAIFRGGLQGRLSKLSKKLRIGDFVIPALITSVIFVALHETADPLLFATRLVHAMVLSYVYHKEGILASMAAHGFFNGLLAVSVVLAAAGVPWLGLAVVPAALFFAYKAIRVLRAQKPDAASGALAPKRMSGLLAILFSALLLAGYFFLMPNIFWAIGAAALFINGIAKLKKQS